jgi:hypothetical protein
MMMQLRVQHCVNQLNRIGRNQKRVFSRRMKKAVATTTSNIAEMVAATVALQKQ